MGQSDRITLFKLVQDSFCYIKSVEITVLMLRDMMH